MPEAIRVIDKIQDMADFNGESFADGQFMVWDAANQTFTSTEFITQSDGITITAGAGRTALVVNGGDVDFGGGKHCLSSNGLIHLFGLGNPDATDKEQLQLGWDTTTSTYKIQTRKSGSGVLRRLYIHSDGTVIQQQAGQTSNLLEFQNSSGVVLSYVTAAGVFNGDGSGLTNLTATNINGAVPITKGGTGQITANAALNALLPSQTSNSSKYLQTDGTNTSWASVAQANPTASVGLSAVNGSASTFMRSDAAPALSQSIAPTWTGLHTFQAATSAKAVIFKAAATTPANITEWQSSGGTALAVIDSTGKMGVGISSPTYHLHLYSTSTGGTAIRLDNADTGGHNFRIYSTGSANNGGAGCFMIYDETSAVFKLRITPSNTFVIGDATAQLATSIFGANNTFPLLITNGAGSNVFLFNVDSSGNTYFKLRDGSAVDTVLLNTVGASYFNGGKVGVGTNNPTAQFQVHASSLSTIGCTIRAAASATANIQEWQNSSGTVLSKITSSGYFVCDGGQSNSLALGSISSIGGPRNTIVGISASGSVNDCVAIGYGATVGAGGLIAIGSGANSGTSGITIGYNSSGPGIVIGNGISASNGTCMAIGSSATNNWDTIIGLGITSASSGGFNTVLGYGSAISTSASQTVVIGYGASCNSNSVAVGYGANATNNSSVGGVAIGKSASGTGGGVAVGMSASAPSYVNVAVGYQANATGSVVAIGYGAYGNFENVAVGYQAATSSGGGASRGSIAIGLSASATGHYSIAIGRVAAVAYDNSIVFGNGATATATAQLVMGNITSAYFGAVTASSPSAITINATGGSGTDIGGANLVLAGGIGTGSGAGGNVKIQTTVAGTTGATARSLVDVVTISSTTQNVLIQTSAVGTVGLVVKATASQTGDLLQIQDSSGGVKLKIDSSFNISRPGSGLNSEQFGLSATTSANNNALAVGYNASSSAQSIAIGASSSTTSSNSAAVGNSSTAYANSTAVGSSASASGSNSVVVGYGSTSAYTYGIAIGVGVTTPVTDCIGIGGRSVTLAGTTGGAIAIGSFASATNRATAVGYTATANIDGSTALGYGTQATGAGSIAVGHAASCSTPGVAIGSSAGSSSGGGGGGIAIGYSAQANAGANNIAIGATTVAGHNYVICLGFGATSTAANQMMIGSTTGPTNSMVFVSGGTTAISVAAPVQAAGSTAGRNITLSASNAIGGSSTQNAAAGGAVTITAGNAARTDTNSGAALGGSITLTAGDGIGTSAGGSGGSINLVGGNCTINNAGAVNITGGAASGSGTGGYVNITGGAGGSTSGGYIVLLSGAGGSSLPTGNISLTTPANSGSAAGSTTGSISLTTGNTAGTSSASGSISLTVGTNSSSSGTCGGISMTTGGFSGTNPGAGTTGSFTLTIPSGPDTTPNSSSNPSAGSFTLTVGNGGSTSGINSTAGNGGSITMIAGNGGNATATSGSTTNGGNGGNVTIRAGSGGTAFNTAGTVGQVLMQVSGGTTVMTLSPSTQNVLIQTSAANVVGQVIKATASQTANMFELRDSSNVAIMTITPGGVIDLPVNGTPSIGNSAFGGAKISFPNSGIIKLDPASNCGLTSNVVYSSSTAQQDHLTLTATVTQTSSAGYRGLVINPTLTSLGSATNRFIDVLNGSTSRFYVDTSGVTVHTVAGAATGTNGLTVTLTPQASQNNAEAALYANLASGYSGTGRQYAVLGNVSTSGSGDSVCISGQYFVNGNGASVCAVEGCAHIYNGSNVRLVGGYFVGLGRSTNPVPKAAGVVGVGQSLATTYGYGGYFALHQGGDTLLFPAWEPVTGVAALCANNRDTAANIFLGMVNGTTYTTIGPNGQTTLAVAAANVIPLTVKGFTSQSSNLQEWQDSSANILSTISENGYYTTRKNSAPADAELSAGELALWFDSTNGAGKLMIKAKTANGTVVTGQVALS
jgi:hypothetical protein